MFQWEFQGTAWFAVSEVPYTNELYHHRGDSSWTFNASHSLSIPGVVGTRQTEMGCISSPRSGKNHGSPLLFNYSRA